MKRLTILIIKPTRRINFSRTEELSQTCRVLNKNKFEKIVRLVDFIIRLYHDARSSERQIRLNMQSFAASVTVLQALISRSES